jgi:hypothetical protein
MSCDAAALTVHQREIFTGEKIYIYNFIALLFKFMSAELQMVRKIRMYGEKFPRESCDSERKKLEYILQYYTSFESYLTK